MGENVLGKALDWISKGMTDTTETSSSEGGEGREEEQRDAGSVLIEACRKGQLLAVREVLKLAEGTEVVNAIDSDGGTWCTFRASPLTEVLYHADRNGGELQDERIEIAGVLLESGADPNMSRQDYDWRGCGSSNKPIEMLCELMIAESKRKDAGIATWASLFPVMVTKGADVETNFGREFHTMRSDGRTMEGLIHLAVKAQDTSMLAAVISAGADVNAMRTSYCRNERGA